MELLTGIHQPGWLFGTCRTPPHAPDFPVFPSFSTLRKVKTLKPAMAPFGAMDSGGFTELQKNGRWTIGEEEYVDACRRIVDQVGMPGWIAPQDWMCERPVIEGGRFKGQDFAGTGLSVIEHQHRTVDNGARLHDMAPDLPFIYVLQGDKPADYVKCFELYQAAGVDLTKEDLVGVGSVCRIQDTQEAVDIFTAIAELGIPRVHGFGVKIDGIRQILAALAEIDRLEMLGSTDTQVWSWVGRRLQQRVPGCDATHKNCANCITWMIRHTKKLRAQIDGWERQFTQGPVQLAFGAMDTEAAA